MNKYTCSDGKQVSQAYIDKKRSKVYRDIYDSQYQTCHGCGAQAQGSAHIIPQARCKQISKTDLIWNPVNFFPACHSCNSAIENPKGDRWKKLNNIEYCLEIIEKYDQELYQKFISS